MAPTRLPDSERGDPGNLLPSWSTLGRREWEAMPSDLNVDLRFPQSVEVYDRMHQTDGQVGSVFRAIRQPLLRAKWDLRTDGVRPEVVQRVREDLGLPAEGENLPFKRASGIVWTEHLRDAVDSLIYGFAVFEQLYRVTDGVHLVKLAPRLPTTIDRILVAPDGGLEAVIQKPPLWSFGQRNWQGIVLPVDRVVVYSHERKGADWYGRSILRTAYKAWLLKDKAELLNVQGIERNSMGVPVVTIADESHRENAERVVEDFRAGATSGLVLGLGDTIQLLGVTGTTRDALPTITYYDQAISRASLEMFLDLGHDAGARSLGDVFLQVFNESLQELADWLAATATEHIIRDLVVHAFGPDEPFPILTPGDLADQGVLTATDLQGLITAGAITADEPLEDFLRRRGGLPKRSNVPVLAPGVEQQPVEQRINQPIPSSAVPPTTNVDVTDEELAGYAGGLIARIRKAARRK